MAEKLLAEITKLLAITCLSGKEPDIEHQILAKIRGVVENIENPYFGEIDFHQNIRLARRQGFDSAKQAILKAIA